MTEAAAPGAPAGGRAVDEFRAHWRLLLGCLIGTAVGISSLPYYTTGVFIGELSKEFGWSRGAVASSTLALTLGMALSSPLAGKLIDRFGARGIACASLACVGGGFFALAAMPKSLVYFYAVILVMAIFGIGSAAIGYTRLVNQRFRVARGLALGIVLTGTGVGAVFGPKVAAAVIGESDWRTAYAVLGITALSAIPFVLLLIRRDAARVVPVPGLVIDPFAHMPLSLHRTPLYWHLSAIFGFTALGIGGMIVHLVPILTDGGASLADAANYASLTGMAVIVGRLLIGWLIDRVFAPYVAAAAFALSALGCVLLLGGTWAAPFTAVLLGLAMGAEVDLVGYFVARYFGMDNYGRIYGWLYAAFLVGIGASPALTGLLFDHTGSYVIAQWASAAFLLASTGLMLRLPRFPVAAGAVP